MIYEYRHEYYTSKVHPADTTLRGGGHPAQRDPPERRNLSKSPWPNGHQPLGFSSNITPPSSSILGGMMLPSCTARGAGVVRSEETLHDGHF